jgi:transposase
MALPAGDYSGVKTVRVGFDDQAKRFVAWMTVAVPEAKKKTDGYWVYFDPGCKTTLTGITTEGRFVEYDINPLRNMNMSTYRLLDKLSSHRDTKKKGSLAWRRLNKRIAALWRKVAGRTKSYLHTLANQILIQHPEARGFKIGDWDKQATLAVTPFPFVNRRINRAVQNNNPVRKLVEMLSYKA